MAQSHFSALAKADLKAIAAYTVETWGEAQAARYLLEMEIHCQQLADWPLLGRPCEDLAADLKRSEHGKHVIFYRQTPAGVTVSRILHQSMLPEHQFR